MCLQELTLPLGSYRNMYTNEANILASWQHNAHFWVDVLDKGELETRRLVTNEAVIRAVRGIPPAMVLDAGCGEGWLCRALQQQGIQTVGGDGVAELIQQARLKGPGHFEVMSFEEMLERHPWPQALFDAVVFNFCLYGKELTQHLLQQALQWVHPGGKLVLQTLHPYFITQHPGEKYIDGWRTEQWAGLNRPFTHPYQWYYRTFSSWLKLVQQAGWQIVEVQEPVHPLSGKPASLLLIARSKDGRHHIAKG